MAYPRREAETATTGKDDKIAAQGLTMSEPAVEIPDAPATGG
jgi:hypothetical protein